MVHAQCTDPITFCVVTAKCPISYLPTLTHTLQTQEASFVIIDVDNSTTTKNSTHITTLTPQRLTLPCTPGFVGCPVQQQALDVMNALETCAKHTPNSQWLCLLEDDMIPCPNSISTIHSFIQSIPGTNNYKSARFAKYSRAAAFPISSIAPYTQFVKEHISDIPYDTAMNYEWAPGTDYRHKGSLFAHQGTASTIAERNDEEFIRTYSDLRNEACGDPL
jgi:hypothetical protein